MCSISKVTAVPEAPRKSPWSWVPSLYFAEGIPYTIVMTISVIMYAKLGVSNTKIALFTSLLGLPWVIKPLWGPLVDLYWTKRGWVIWMQFLMAGAFGLLALTLNVPWWWTGTLVLFAAGAFLSATHDIAADGFYMLGLGENQQAKFVGVRSMFYRFAMITGQGLLIIAVGMVESRTGPKPTTIAVYTSDAKAASASDIANEGTLINVTPARVLLSPGTTTSLAVTLAEAPQTTRVITLSQRYSKAIYNFFPVGDESLIKVAKGNDRLEFSPENYKTPKQVVIEADAKLKEPTLAVFEVRAGNIQFSWTICFAVMSALFVLLAMYHWAALPRPVTDTNAGLDRPPFGQAAGWMLLTIILPVWALIASFYGFRNQGGWLLEKFGFVEAAIAGEKIARAGEQGLKAIFLSVSAADALGLLLTAIFVTALLAAAATLKKQAQQAGAATESRGSQDIAIIMIALLSVVLFFGLKPIVRGMAVDAESTLKNDALTFLTNLAIVLFAWLFFVSRRVQSNSLSAFKGASVRSGIPFAEVFISFFRKPGIGRMLAFLLLYRLGEAMLVKISGPFLIGDRAKGGMGLSTSQYGLAYGTIGMLMLTIGGVCGGYVASKVGLKRVIFWMCLAINLPDALYVYLAYYQPEQFWVTLACVGGEALGYGFGFAAYMLYMLYVAGEGEHKTSHFAICTGFMALGMMLPGMISGAVQEAVGYYVFFIIVCIATLPGFITLLFIPLDPEFGRRKSSASSG